MIADSRTKHLLELGDQMLELERQRQQLIEAIRLVHRAATSPPAAAPPAVVAQPTPATLVEQPVAVIDIALGESGSLVMTAAASGDSALAVPVIGARVPSAPEGPPEPPVAASVAPRAPRRHLSVPVLLLIVGVTLVGIAAIFFLVVAWNNADIGVKSIIIGGVTLATIVAASVLRRYALKATAEAVAVLGVILLALDAWAVRLNDLFGAGGMAPAVYAGLAALIVGVVCRVWSVFSRLRGPDLAATLALPAGLGLLVAGLLPLETNAAITAGFLGAAVGGLAHALPAPLSAARSGRDSVPERTALMIIGVTALFGAAVMTLLAGLESMAVQLVAAAVVIGLGVAYTALLREREDAEPLPAARVFRSVAASTAAGVTALLGWQMAMQSDMPVYPELIAPVVAVGAAVALDRWHPADRIWLAPRITAAVVGVASIVTVFFFGLVRAVDTVGRQWLRWDTPAFAPPTGSDVGAAVLAAIAAEIVAALLFFAPSLARPAVRDVTPVAAALLVLVGAAATAIPIVIVAAGIATAAVALFALSRKAAPIGWGVAAGVGALAAFLAGLAAPWLWVVGVVVALAVPVLARVLVRPGVIGAVALALAPVAVAVVAAIIAPEAIGAAFDVIVDPRSPFVMLQWVALFALAAAVVLPLDDTSRTTLAISSYAPLVVSFAMFAAPLTAHGEVSAVLGEPYLAIARTAALIALLALVALRRTLIDRSDDRGPAALGASAFIAPVAAGLAVAILTSFQVTAAVWLATGAASAAVVVVWLGALAPATMYGRPPADDPETDAITPDERRTSARPRRSYGVLARAFADAGAAVTVLIAAVAGDPPADLRWLMLVIVAVGFAGASVTRGWAAPQRTEPIGVPETHVVGAPLVAAPRRLLAWAAFAVGTLALWSWLDVSGSFEVEAYALPPAVGLLLFSAALTWLRRDAEATIGVVLGLTLGLVVPALIGTSGPQLRGTVVAIVAAAVALALAWTPARRVRTSALAGALVAIVAVAVTTVWRAVGEPATPAWLLLFVGVAYAAGYGFAQGSKARASGIVAPDPRRAESWFALGVPPAALGVASAATWPSTDEPLVVVVAFATLGALHLAAAWLDRAPLGGATRWTALAGTVLVATGAFLTGDIDAIELVSVPIAVLLLAGAVLAMWRRSRMGLPWPSVEQIPWLAGLAVAVVPSVVAEANDVRTWLVIVATLLVAVECLVIPVRAAEPLKAPSAILLTAGTLAMGFRALLDPAVQTAELAGVVAGTGGLLVAGVMIWMAEPEARVTRATWLAAASAALLVLDVGLHLDPDLTRTSLTVVTAAVIAVGGAAMLQWPRWAPLGGVLAVGGTVAAVLAAGYRYAVVLADSASGIEPDFWAIVGTGIVAAVGIMAVRSSPSAIVATVVGVVFCVSLVMFAAAELLLLGRDGDGLRTVLTMTALTVAGLVGVIRPSRTGVWFAATAASAAVIFGGVALAGYGVRPVELVTVPPAIGLILLGARAMRRSGSVRSWPALGPGLALLTLPSLVYDFTDPSLVVIGAPSTLWRVVALGVIAVAMVVVGALYRLQAPLALGSVVLLTHAVAQLWPWISNLYTAVPWWLWLGVGGALLIYLAARYERRLRDLRAAFTAVTSLR